MEDWIAFVGGVIPGLLVGLIGAITVVWQLEKLVDAEKRTAFLWRRFLPFCFGAGVPPAAGFGLERAQVLAEATGWSLSDLAIGYLVGVAVCVLPILGWRLVKIVRETSFKDGAERDLTEQVVRRRLRGESADSVAASLDLTKEQVDKIYGDCVRLRRRRRQKQAPKAEKAGEGAEKKVN
ncbi:hypothetical protein JYT86_00545 [bacterium AH-315-N03]|nr:hypothetical protein [bacterium AH-315-N03]